MSQVLGWLDVGLLLVLMAPYCLRFLNDRMLHLKGGGYAKVIKFLRSIHKPLGVGTLLVTLIHGYLALGGFSLHTGTLALIALLVTASLGLLFYLLKKRNLFVWHKYTTLAIMLLLLVHLIFPSAMYYLFH